VSITISSPTVMPHFWNIASSPVVTFSTAIVCAGASR